MHVRCEGLGRGWNGYLRSSRRHSERVRGACYRPRPAPQCGGLGALDGTRGAAPTLLLAGQLGLGGGRVGPGMGWMRRAALRGASALRPSRCAYAQRPVARPPGNRDSRGRRARVRPSSAVPPVDGGAVRCALSLSSGHTRSLRYARTRNAVFMCSALTTYRVYIRSAIYALAFTYRGSWMWKFSN